MFRRVAHDGHVAWIDPSYPEILGLIGIAYFTVAVLLSLAFLSYGISCAATRSRIDARKLFFASIIYLPLLLAAMMVDRL